MKNISVGFIMTAYTAIEDHTYLLFSVFLLLYILTIFGSLLIIIAIFCERTLYKPMYFLVCNLTLNGLYGSTAFLPSLLRLIVSESYELSLQCCLAQVYFLHTFGIVEFTILAVMGYDRYVAICYPLHYHCIMSVSRICQLNAFCWIYPWTFFLIYYTLTLQLKYCSRFIDKLYCVNFELVKISCTDAPYISIVGLFMIFVFIVPQLLMIVFSYAQILRICLQTSDSQLKALKTCIPHLVSTLNYSLGALFEVIQTRFNMSYVPNEVRIFMSLYFIVMPPLLNPVIYGISLKAIRMQVLKMLCIKNKLTPNS